MKVLRLEFKGEIIQKKLLELDSFKKSKTVSVYVSFKGEVGTDMILQTLFQSGINYTLYCSEQVD